MNRLFSGILVVFYVILRIMLDIFDNVCYNGGIRQVLRLAGLWMS